MQDEVLQWGVVLQYAKELFGANSNAASSNHNLQFANIRRSVSASAKA
jgi:hypothetical protein